MCGILAGYTPHLAEGLVALRHRGPDAQGIVQRGDLWLGHTRLAILDIDPRSNQPFTYGSVTLTYNGELWNYQALRKELQALGAIFHTTGDTEVVAAALAQWGLDALPRFNGMFALAWTTDGRLLYLARDRYGEVPLHVAYQRPFLCASEIKALLALGVAPASIGMLLPGHVATVTATSWLQQPYAVDSLVSLPDGRPQAASRLQTLLLGGCYERAMADVPVCTLLSGGIDSAAIAYGMAQEVPGLVAYTAVHDPRSLDLRCARLVADALRLELREVCVPVPTLADLSEAIHHIEMPHKAQVEIGWACLCLARQMQQDGFKVTLSGEGSDELWASYGFAYHALQQQNWHAYRHALFLGQHRKNFARCNKIFMAHGIECRLPFLHPPLVAYALRLSTSAVQDGRSRPKAILQDAMRGLLPPRILQRPKIAFQDGMGLKAAIRQLLPLPERFYHAEYARHFPGVATRESRPRTRRQMAVR